MVKETSRTAETMNNHPPTPTPTPTPTFRAFIAIELPKDALDVLSAAQDTLRARLGRAAGAVRWVRAEGIHLTLQFLGSVPEASVEQIQQAMRAGSERVGPLTLSLSGIGAFPNPRRPRVIWVGIGGDERSLAALHALQAGVARELSVLGYMPDKQFHPHLTLGRVREDAKPDEVAAIADAVAKGAGAPPPHSFHVNSVSLMQSDLRPGGAVYTRRAALKLSGGIREP
jgi:2'-5' RNA ligase